ncbi:TRAP transporter substrate-binding protein [Roseovarius sp.]|uniref:TRAP transporter substrate-binding protein n=1 Tax=Roseovarius sp. TaxID=1486281 RepID=UPI003B599EBB
MSLTKLLLSFIAAAVIATVSTSAQAQEYRAIFASGFKPNSPHHQAALKMKEEVEAASDGRIEITLLHSGQGGSAREAFEALQIGSMQITWVPTARISGFVPDLQVLDLPYLFPNREKMIDVLDGPVGKELLEVLTPQGVRGVGYYVDGFKNMTANKPLRTLDDFEGFKMRTMESGIIMEQYRALGADPVPVAFLEVYNALQMNMVDGQENPVNLIHDMKFYEVQDYLMLTEHAMLAGVLIYSSSWFDSLPADLQSIMMEAGKKMIDRQRAGVQEVEAADLERIRESGTEIVTITDAQKAAFREATLPVHKIFSDERGGEMLKKIYAATQ